MTDAKLWAKVLAKCDKISEEQQKHKTDLQKLQALTGALVAEINMLKERFDIATNADFLKDVNFVDKKGRS